MLFVRTRGCQHRPALDKSSPASGCCLFEREDVNKLAEARISSNAHARTSAANVSRPPHLVPAAHGLALGAEVGPATQNEEFNVEFPHFPSVNFQISKNERHDNEHDLRQKLGVDRRTGIPQASLQSEL
ncbi:hypothetical protein J6590_047207, partial [Homalodisca vitripennis]